jgi:hypothetical protein
MKKLVSVAICQTDADVDGIVGLRARETKGSGNDRLS